MSWDLAFILERTTLGLGIRLAVLAQLTNILASLWTTDSGFRMEWHSRLVVVLAGLTSIAYISGTVRWKVWLLFQPRPSEFPSARHPPPEGKPGSQSCHRVLPALNSQDSEQASSTRTRSKRLAASLSRSAHESIGC